MDQPPLPPPKKKPTPAEVARQEIDSSTSSSSTYTQLRGVRDSLSGEAGRMTSKGQNMNVTSMENCLFELPTGKKEAASGSAGDGGMSPLDRYT